MIVVYLETSAVLRWLLRQRDGEDVRRSVDRAERVLTSIVTRTEAERAIVRGETGGALTAGDAQRVRGILHRAQASWTRMGVSEDVLARAARPFPVEPVRTSDAIHLATALEFTTVFPDLKLLSFDRRVQENAVSLGIA